MSLIEFQFFLVEYDNEKLCGGRDEEECVCVCRHAVAVVLFMPLRGMIMLLPSGMRVTICYMSWLGIGCNMIMEV